MGGSSLCGGERGMMTLTRALLLRASCDEEDESFATGSSGLRVLALVIIDIAMITDRNEDFLTQQSIFVKRKTSSFFFCFMLIECRRVGCWWLI